MKQCEMDELNRDVFPGALELPAECDALRLRDLLLECGEFSLLLSTRKQTIMK